MTTGLARLVGPNAAYEAAVRAAADEGKVARALVLPVTRGDSLYASPFLYWAQRSRPPLEERVDRLRADPRLRFLASDRGTRAFAVVPDAGDGPPSSRKETP